MVRVAFAIVKSLCGKFNIIDTCSWPGPGSWIRNLNRVTLPYRPRVQSPDPKLNFNLQL